VSGTVYGSDAVSLTGGTVAAFSSRNAGSYTPTVSGLSLTGADAGNYQLSSTSATAGASIIKAALTITAQANTKIYDGTTTSATNAAITAGGIQTGDTAPAWTQTYDNKDSGTGKTLTPSILVVTDGNGGANYNYTYTAASVGVINKATAAFDLLSPAPTNGYQAAVFFTATNLPVEAASNVVFSANGVSFSTNAVVSGGAASLSLTNLPRGTNLIAAIYAGDLNYLATTNTLNQVVTNHPPVANAVACNRGSLASWKISISDLLTNATDVDADTLTLAGVGVSTNGVTLDTNSYPGYVAYYNAGHVDDEFSYTVSDGFGGTSTGIITLAWLDTNAVTGPITGQITSFIGGVANLTFHGIPNYPYITERTTNLTDWVGISTNNAATNGVINVSDTFSDLGGVPPASAYYRLKYQP
jgi:hypothetical protein